MISKEVKRMLTEAINRIAAEKNLEPNQVAVEICPVPHTVSEFDQSVIYLPGWRLRINNTDKTEDVEFLYLLNEDVDFQGREEMAQMFLQTAFEVLAKDYKTTPEQLYLHACINRKGILKLFIYLADGDKITGIKPLTFEYLFMEEEETAN